MTNIKHVKITRKDDSEVVFEDITQIYTVGNFITVSGKLIEEFLQPGITVSRYQIDTLKSMMVEFS